MSIENNNWEKIRAKTNKEAELSQEKLKNKKLINQYEAATIREKELYDEMDKKRAEEEIENKKNDKPNELNKEQTEKDINNEKEFKADENIDVEENEQEIKENKEERQEKNTHKPEEDLLKNEEEISVEDINKKYFSYSDVQGEAEEERQENITPTRRKYAESLKKIINNEKFEPTYKRIKEIYNSTMNKLGIETTIYGNSISWTYWDIAKQNYFFNNRKEADPRYDIGDPLANRNIQKQIADRHIGWETHMAVRRMTYSEQVRFMSKISGNNFIRKIKINRLLAKRVKPENNELSSLDYSKLGKLIRESVEKK